MKLSEEFCSSLKLKYILFYSQAYCNILAGACMALGLKFAGSANTKAFETLFKYAKTFTSLTGKSIAELAGKSTIETCLNVILLSLAMVSCKFDCSVLGKGNCTILVVINYKIKLQHLPKKNFKYAVEINMAQIKLERQL